MHSTLTEAIKHAEEGNYKDIRKGDLEEEGKYCRRFNEEYQTTMADAIEINKGEFCLMKLLLEF